MNIFLRRMHAKKNIDLLKARDFYFDRARDRSKWFKRVIIAPPIIASLTYVPYFIQLFPYVEMYRDFIVGTSTVVFVVIGTLIQKKNDEDLVVSNALREEYDLNIFEIDRNDFAYDEAVLKNDNGEYKDEIIKAWNSRPDSNKYEVWYQEIFTDDKNSNILCLQLDSILYTYYIYKDYMGILNINMFIGIGTIIIFLFISVLVWGDVKIFILIIFSLFGALQSQIADYKKVQELISANLYTYKYILNNSKEIKTKLANEKEGRIFIRALQNVIINNRDKGLFVPLKVRYKYYDNGNPYYRELDNIKREYMVNPYMPNKAEDIEILSSDTDEVTANIKGVHDRLLVMFKDVDRVFRDEGVNYFLDGGSLIGAMRSEKGFIFWDDDIDISLLQKDVEKAKEAIRNRLGDKYEVQDYYNDDYYSPRLSTFRIREKNEKSIIEEKDSELCHDYKYKGIFIDVYSYSPIVVNKSIDGFVRKLLIQGFGTFFSKGLYTQIRNEEKLWKYDGQANREKHFKKYLKLKKKYLERVSLYFKLANNEDYYACAPYYIDNLKKPGPYVSAKSLISDKKYECDFEDMKSFAPPDPYTVLASTYGEKWNISPFKSLEELKGKDGYEFSKKVFDPTALKHIKYINRF